MPTFIATIANMVQLYILGMRLFVVVYKLVMFMERG